MEQKQKIKVYILLIVLIAIGGIVLYGKDKEVNTNLNKELTPPKIKGPTSPPPTSIVPPTKANESPRPN